MRRLRPLRDRVGKGLELLLFSSNAQTGCVHVIDPGNASALHLTKKHSNEVRGHHHLEFVHRRQSNLTPTALLPVKEEARAGQEGSKRSSITERQQSNSRGLTLYETVIADYSLVNCEEDPLTPDASNLRFGPV